MLHRTRHLFIRQQTAVINSIRAHLAEFGIVAPVGRRGVTELLHVVVPAFALWIRRSFRGSLLPANSTKAQADRV
jgi:transposase